MNKEEKEILRLTSFWYDYVGKDHHKDRDCHWYINGVWSYGKPPIFRLEHYGYIAHEVEAEEFSTHKEAQIGLIALLEEIILEEKSWANMVLKSKKGEWDNLQIEQAKMIDEFVLHPKQ